VFRIRVAEGRKGPGERARASDGSVSKI